VLVTIVLVNSYKKHGPIYEFRGCFSGQSKYSIHQASPLTSQYGPEDDALSLYSAMPSVSAAGNRRHAETDVVSAIEDLSIDNGNGGHQHGDEDYDDLHAPLGENVEHACR
jgi:hypothetical protein